MVSAPSYRPTPAMAILLKLWMLAWGLSLASAILTCGTCESGASSLTCPDSFNMQYTVNLYPSDGELDKSLHLKCDYFTPKLNFTWLQGCSFPTVIYVKIEQCPLFDESIASVLEKIGVAPANVKHLVWETSLPAEAGPHSWHLERLGNLTSLQIHRNEFTSLPDSFLQTTPLLEKLYITGNSLGELPSDLLTYSPNITTLDIGNNKLTSVPENLLQNVPSLQIFNIWTNELTSIPPRLFANLPQLHTIGLSENSLTSLDSQLFSNMKKLHTLDIRINQLESLPNSLFEGCSNLTSVSLQFNKIPSLPPSLFQGTAIKFLHIGYNELANITTTLQNLPTLENVTLHKNHILGLEADLFQGSPNIVQLDLQANAIQFLADGVLDNLSKLKVFLINNNYLEELPPALFRDCISLLRVFMQNNHLTTIPADTFPEHSSIVKLDLSDNQLTLLADGFFHPLNKLTNIEELYLANNLVSYIFTDALHLFTRLRVLNLKNNNLTSLTDHDLDFISKNVTLYLQDNQITNISTTIYLGIGSIDEIISIYLEGNPLNCNCQMHSFLKAAQFTPPFTYNRPYNLIVADARQSMCAEPETYEGTSLDNVDASKVLCSYDCSPECSCDIRLDDKYVLIDCSDRELFEAPSFIDSFVDDTKLFKLSLDLSNNAYENVSFLSDPDLHNLVNVDLSNNSLSELNETYLPATLQFIDLRFNNFSAMPGALVEYFNSTAMTLLLGDNPWTCDCELKSFHEFLRNNYELVRDRQNVVCVDEEQGAVDELTAEELCSFLYQPATVTGIAVGTLILLLIAVLVTATWYRHKEMIKVWLYTHNTCLWAVTEQEIDADKKYDAFISYSYKDEGFVNDILVPGLENGDPKYRVCLHYRDWIPGEYIQEQILTSVKASRRTIVVLSKNFVESVWGQLEFKAAHSQALQDKTNRIIVVVYGEVPTQEELDGELKLYVATNTYLKWGDQRFWERLRYAMPHSKYQPYKKSKVDKLELVKPAPKSATKTLDE